MSLRYVNNCLAGRQEIVAEFDEPVAENKSDRDRMMKLYALVSVILSFPYFLLFDDRLMVVEQCNEKLREGKKLVYDAKKERKPQVEAIKLKDQALEMVNQQAEDNLRLKKQLEVVILEASNVREEQDSALVEVFELKKSILNEREAAVHEFLGTQNFHKFIRPYYTPGDLA